MSELRVVGEIPDELVARLRSVERLATLEDVLAWCRLHASEIVDVIVQDEYTHDVLVRGVAPAYVIFDTT
jgi:hypothetical protein